MEKNTEQIDEKNNKEISELFLNLYTKCKIHKEKKQNENIKCEEFFRYYKYFEKKASNNGGLF